MWNVRCVDQTNCKEPIAQPFPMVIDQWYVTIGFCGIWPSMVRMFLIISDMHRLKSMVSHGAKVYDVLYDQWYAHCTCWNLRNLIRIDEILWYLMVRMFWGSMMCVLHILKSEESHIVKDIDDPWYALMKFYGISWCEIFRWRESRICLDQGRVHTQEKFIVQIRYHLNSP